MLFTVTKLHFRKNLQNQQELQDTEILLLIVLLIEKTKKLKLIDAYYKTKSLMNDVINN